MFSPSLHLILLISLSVVVILCMHMLRNAVGLSTSNVELCYLIPQSILIPKPSAVGGLVGWLVGMIGWYGRLGGWLCLDGW